MARPDGLTWFGGVTMAAASIWAAIESWPLGAFGLGIGSGFIIGVAIMAELHYRLDREKHHIDGTGQTS